MDYGSDHSKGEEEERLLTLLYYFEVLLTLLYLIHLISYLVLSLPLPCSRKIRRRINDEIFNLKSRWQLFWHRLTHGEGQVEYQELVQEPYKALTRMALHFIDHINLLPTVHDRLQLISEKSWEARKTILAASFALSLWMG